MLEDSLASAGYISFAVVAGLCQGMVCANCSLCLLPRQWRDKHCFHFLMCGQVAAGRSMRTHRVFSFKPRWWIEEAITRQVSARNVASCHVGGE